MEQKISTDGGSLAALLDATSRGDRAAFRALYEATAPKLFGIVIRITRNRSTAEEVLQETFIKIWQNAERFTPDAGQPMGWLAAIARNRAIDRLRSERIERNRAQDDDQILERLAAPVAGDPGMRQALSASALDSSTRKRETAWSSPIVRDFRARSWRSGSDGRWARSRPSFTAA